MTEQEEEKEGAGPRPPPPPTPTPTPFSLPPASISTRRGDSGTANKMRARRRWRGEE